jgi:hypothetical protein
MLLPTENAISIGAIEADRAAKFAPSACCRCRRNETMLSELQAASGRESRPSG